MTDDLRAGTNRVSTYFKNMAGPGFYVLVQETVPGTAIMGPTIYQGPERRSIHDLRVEA